MLEEILQSGFEALELTPDRAAIGRYRKYYERLDEVNRVMNLTAISGEEDTARLHFLDCAAILAHVDMRGARVIDVGTGAGFPGLALKIAQPDISLTLLDSLDKRIGFLRDTVETLELGDVECVHARAEEAAQKRRESYDFATARAVARLEVLCELCLPFVRVGGYFLAMKGSAAGEELAEAKRAVSLLGGRVEFCRDYEIDGAPRTVIGIRKEKPTPPQYPRRFAKIKQSPL